MEWLTSNLLKLLGVLSLVLLNGFFVAAELALVKIRETQIETLVLKGHRRAKIVLLITEPLHPIPRLRRFNLGCTLLGQDQAVGSMRTTRSLAFTACLQPLRRILADRFEHSEADIAIRLRKLPQQTVINQ